MEQRKSISLQVYEDEATKLERLVSQLETFRASDAGSRLFDVDEYYAVDLPKFIGEKMKAVETFRCSFEDLLEGQSPFPTLAHTASILGRARELVVKRRDLQYDPYGSIGVLARCGWIESEVHRVYASDLERYPEKGISESNANQVKTLAEIQGYYMEKDALKALEKIDFSSNKAILIWLGVFGYDINDHNQDKIQDLLIEKLTEHGFLPDERACLLAKDFEPEDRSCEAESIRWISQALRIFSGKSGEVRVMHHLQSKNLRKFLESMLLPER